MDNITGRLRLTFGFPEMMRGVDFLIAVIGLFGIGEILLSMEEGLSFTGKSAKIDPKVVLETWKKLPRYWLTSLRSCLIGCWMGITPGGATPASFMSYGIAKRMSKDGDKFGKGQIEGVIAPETAAHAAGTSALLPMLALGIPGSPTAAVLLGGLLIWGLQPGPLLFVEQKDFVWGLIASMYLGNLAGLIIVLTCVPLFAAILRVPFSIIAPVIVVICAIGAYSVHSAMLDIWFMMLFGVVGYVFKKLDYPLAPLVLALVLGDRAEDSFRQSMLIAQGDMSIFFSNALVGSITGLALVMLFWPLLSPAARGRWRVASGAAQRCTARWVSDDFRMLVTSICPRSVAARRAFGAAGRHAHRAILELRNLAERIEHRIREQIRRRLVVAERNEHRAARRAVVGARAKRDAAAARRDGDHRRRARRPAPRDPANGATPPASARSRPALRCAASCCPCASARAGAR